ncbi:MAG: phosphoenolpyruvate synthase [Candidatus Liptonbacteria bacterium]
MGKNNKFILWYKEIGIEDIPLVGGKNAALGEMVSNLVPMGINVPDGFAISAYAYRYFLEKASLADDIKRILTGLNTHNIADLQRRGKAVRQAVLKAELPTDLKEAVREAYAKMCDKYYAGVDVAVRSSATAEDLPGSSFAGQQETYLNISGIEEVLVATKKCIASLFTDRAISYRTDKGFSHFDVALSVGVQKMVRSDLAVSGVAFTLDTETGFDGVVEINGSYGLGEMIVQGKVTPDEFIVFKPTLEKKFNAIISRTLGEKRSKIIYSKKGIKEVPVPPRDRGVFCLSDKEILKLAGWCVKIEEYFSKKHGHKQPMDIEWAKDGKTKELFIVQARPETIHSSRDRNLVEEYRLQKTGKMLVAGIPVGHKIASGEVSILNSSKQIKDFPKGGVLVTDITDPDWEPIMKIASAIITNKGGRTSHAAIVSRELGIACIVGTGSGTNALKSRQMVTVDCSGEVGKVYEGKLPFERIEHHVGKLPKTRTKIMVNVGSPDEAFQSHYLPAKGVGLGRLEFIIASHIGIHPNVLLDYKKIRTESHHKKELKPLLAEIDKRTAGYDEKPDFYVCKLAEGVAKIGAAFYPHEVIIRFSDFKTNEYRTLLGGELYEPHEENPMLGWRGASRYYDPNFEKAFGLECKALSIVRDEMGLKNVLPIVPFCRTPEEGRRVVASMAKHGLDRKSDKTLKIYVMCEIPSNVLRAENFLEIFDGMSIGSNDLAQLTLGIDRDSSIVAKISNENDYAVKEMIAEAIRVCRKKRKYIGICGQAPSDYPEFAQFLVGEGIESMSLNPDSIIKTIPKIAEAERRHRHLLKFLWR